jgi:hypothetical protein
MEDVLFNRMPLRQRPASPAESASWTGRASAEAEAHSTPALPYPLSALFALIESGRDFPGACQDLAAFLKSLPDRFSAENLLLAAVGARFPRVWMERFLFTLLAMQSSDGQIAGHTLRFRTLKRLLLRVERRAPLSVGESTLARELISALALSRFLDFEPFCATAAATFQALRAGKLAVSGDLGLLIYLIRSELSALGERKRWLEEGLPSGDPSAVARLSPHLDLLEQRMAGAQGLAQRLGTFGGLQDHPMGLEEAMGPFRFERFLEGLKSPALAGLKEVLELQRSKRAPMRDLIALTSLCRWITEARGTSSGPLEWVRMALTAYDHGQFRIDAQGGLPAVEALLREAKVAREGDTVIGDFGEFPFSSWVSRDGLTRPYRSSNPDRLAPDLRRLALANVHREAVILKMLDRPEVREAEGLIAAIVEGSTSSVVHAKIASRPELHAGPACARVPMALLKSTVAIPAPLALPLIHPALVPFQEMKALYRHRAELRPEVAEGLRAFLKQAYAL